MPSPLPPRDHQKKRERALLTKKAEDYNRWPAWSRTHAGVFLSQTAVRTVFLAKLTHLLLDHTLYSLGQFSIAPKVEHAP